MADAGLTSLSIYWLCHTALHSSYVSIQKSDSALLFHFISICSYIVCITICSCTVQSLCHSLSVKALSKHFSKLLRQKVKQLDLNEVINFLMNCLVVLKDVLQNMSAVKIQENLLESKWRGVRPQYQHSDKQWNTPLPKMDPNSQRSWICPHDAFTPCGQFSLCVFLFFCLQQFSPNLVLRESI